MIRAAANSKFGPCGRRMMSSINSSSDDPSDRVTTCHCNGPIQHHHLHTTRKREPACLNGNSSSLYLRQCRIYTINHLQYNTIICTIQGSENLVA
ncbi:hypothetical protein AVEN_130206-1 [Araneus ventricosus]|uniref:Uncharacterized protein n=1 Tax=Araneus ventricosus TaxID=182803 RepID=A0A4Y2QCK6_ARAVE|nr:hypothetical protein AVEN_130206-1 [Araneus ventricosus]